MKKNKEKNYWAFWWEQVNKDFVPECAYRMARIRTKLNKMKEKQSITTGAKVP